MGKHRESRKGIISDEAKDEVKELNGVTFKGLEEENRKQRTEVTKKLAFLIIFPLLLFIIGIVLIILAHIRIQSCDDDLSRHSNIKTIYDINTTTSCNASSEELKEDICDYSNEAKRIGLKKFMNDILEIFHELFPEEISWHPHFTKEMILTRFQVHDPRESNMKKITMTAKELLDEAINLAPDLSKLKPREHKAYLQMLHFLENTFGYAYLNYTAGLWMMGPSVFCQEPICYIQYGIYNSLLLHPPKNKTDLNRLLFHFDAIEERINDYIEVLKKGIQKGMVRTHIECVAGINAIKSKHLNISLNGASGIRGEWYATSFYSTHFYQNISEDLHRQYKKLYGMNVTEYVQSLVEKKIGSSISKLLRYLEDEHLLYCRPDDVGPGGLSALPLEYIYYNGSKLPNKTNPYLDLCAGGEVCRLNGSRSYASILGYFTTKHIHPDEVYKMGIDNLKILYPQVIEVAKEVTGKTEEDEAVKAFKIDLRDLKKSYFNDEPIPENETRGDAFVKCTSEETAKIYCPNRWKAMMKWFKFAQMAMSIHDPKTVNFFYFTGNRQSTPNCPVQLSPDFNPSSGAQSYDNSDANCTYPCNYNIPFFLEDVGPKFSEYSVNAHEARPGHHTQVQGLTEHFREKCGGAEGWLDDKTFYTAFTEGWALYAENPLIAQGTDIYKDNPMQKYGMLKWQIWRALRLIVDTGLHYKGMSRKTALDYFAKYAWDSTDLGKKEVTRYQSNAGQATAYMIGQLDIWRLRNKTEELLGSDYSLKEFHLQALSQGSSPLEYLESYMDKFIRCKHHPTEQYCDIVLNPTKSSKKSSPYIRSKKIKWPRERHYL